MNQRASGILLHPTSLSNPDPIGDLGPAATTFADFLVQGGQRWWQMLPIGPAGEKNSPCQSLSGESRSVGGAGACWPPGYRAFYLRGEGKMDYPAAAHLKPRWLKKAFEHFEKNRHRGGQSAFDAFAGETVNNNH
jgi:4-alpha-glucanotransferase